MMLLGFQLPAALFLDPHRYAVEVIDATARMAGKGVRTQSVAIDWQELMRFKRSETEPAPQFFVQNFARAGICSREQLYRLIGPGGRSAVTARQLSLQREWTLDGAAPVRSTVSRGWRTRPGPLVAAAAPPA